MYLNVTLAFVKFVLYYCTYRLDCFASSPLYTLHLYHVALGGLCAAASAAVIELLPFVHTVELQALLAMVFPSGAAMFAAAASVSKARCEVWLWCML